MKISQKLPQFEKGPALIIVSGSLEAEFYIGHKGETDKADHIKREKPNYSDREDFGRRNSMAYETGAVFERQRVARRKEFIKLFREHVKTLNSKFDFTEVYLLAPAIIIEDLGKALPATLAKKMRKILKGDYQKKDLVEILEKIKTRI